MVNMRIITFFFLLFSAGCNSSSSGDGLQLCQPDGTACTADEQCCGSAEPKPAWGGKLENVHGACKLAGKCCTWFEEDGWITLLCGDESVSFPPQTR